MFAWEVIYYIIISSLNSHRLIGMDKENQCFELSEKTADILDNNMLLDLFVSTQENNLDLCIIQGIK